MKNFLMLIMMISMFFGGVDALAAKRINPAKSAVRRNGGFTLKNQNDAAVAVKFPRGKVTVLIFGDREGAEQIEGWVRPMYNQYADKIDVYGIAELSAVPSLMRGVVRRIIKSKTKYSVLLDWSGAVAKSYGYQKGKATVVVIGKNGAVLGKRTGAANRYGLLGVYKHINSGL